MSLTKKILLLTAALFISSIFLLYGVSRAIILKSFSKIELEKTKTNIERVNSAFQQDLSALVGVNLEYSRWSDTYQYMEDRSETYIESNFTDINTLQKFRVDFLMFVTTEGEIIYEKAVDEETGKETRLHDALKEEILFHESLRDARNKIGTAGIILLKEGPMMVTSYPILPNDGVGPNRGFLIMSRFFDHGQIQKLAQITHLDISMVHFRQSFPKEFQEAYEKMITDPIHIKPLSGESIAGYGIIKDIYGSPAVFLKVSADRDIYKQGKTSLGYFMISIIGVGIMISMGMVLILKGLVLERLSEVSVCTTNIGITGDLSTRIPMKGQDELSRVVRSINHMLEELQEAQSEISQRELKYRSLFENMNEGFTYNKVIVDQKGIPVDFIILEANDEFVRIIGLSKDEIVGKTMTEIVQYIDTSEFDWGGVFGTTTVTGESIKMDETYFDRTKKWYTISSYSLENGYLALIFSDISAIKQAEEKIYHIAYHDALTDLPNRKLFLDRLEMKILQAKRYSQKFCVFFLDLDNFKSVNDKLGHDKGDILLKDVASKIKTVVQQQGTVARLGGDEFTIIQSPIESVEDAAKLAQKVLKELDFVFEYDNEKIHVGTSIGISLFPEDGEDYTTLVKNADIAMYRAKKSGRRNYKFYNTDLNQTILIE